MAALVVSGMALCATTASAVAALGHAPRPVRTPDGDPVLIAQGVEAYQREEWEEADHAFREVLLRAPGHARAQDYLERLELIQRDADRLRFAEEALVAGEPERASLLASSVAPNSPLFAQSERVARSAREQLEKRGKPAPRTAPELTPALDVTVALGEALALYESGNFAGAVDRATGLASQAQTELQSELMRWAQDARRFAQMYASLPRDDANLVAHVDDALEAITLDDQLSDGHYARELRERMTTALLALGTMLLDKGDAASGCARVRDAGDFAARSERIEALTRRCENEAFRRIAQARDLERSRPEQALALYRQAVAMAAKDSASRRVAEAAIVDLEWSAPR